MAASLFLAPPPTTSLFHCHRPLLHPALSTKPQTLQASRRVFDYATHQEEAKVTGPRRWSGGGGWTVWVDEDEESEGEDDEDDRSLDLLVRFVQNVFRKVSRRARRSVRSVFPVPISAKLLRFSVDGILVLTFLWILKAFLEVVCALGTVVFVSILLIRGAWTGFTYLHWISRRNPRGFDEDDIAWSSAQQPAT